MATPLGIQDPSRAAEAARYVGQAISHLIPRQQIIDSVVGGYGNPGVTTAVTPCTTGFDTSLQPYSYDVALAKELLIKAGYISLIPEIPSPPLLIVCLMATFALVALFGKDLRKKPLSNSWLRARRSFSSQGEATESPIFGAQNQVRDRSFRPRSDEFFIGLELEFSKSL